MFHTKKNTTKYTIENVWTNKFYVTDYILKQVVKLPSFWGLALITLYVHLVASFSRVDRMLGYMKVNQVMNHSVSLSKPWMYTLGINQKAIPIAWRSAPVRLDGRSCPQTAAKANKGFFLCQNAWAVGFFTSLSDMKQKKKKKMGVSTCCVWWILDTISPHVNPKFQI